MKQPDKYNPDEIDPRLFELLDQLRTTPPRDPEAAARGRMKYMAELESLGIAAPTRSQGRFIPRWLSRLVHKNERENLMMNNRKQRFTLTGAVILMTLLVFLFGGAGMTALASQSSLPGDALYPVKTSLEQTRVALARSASVRAQLQMEFAERRLGEIAGLIEEGRFEDIPTATAEFETYIGNALAELEIIAKGDPEQAAVLAKQVSEALTRYALTLSGMLDQVPESVRLEMRRTLQNTQAAGKTGELEFSGTIEKMDPQAWVVASRTIGLNAATEMKGPFVIGDVVKVHAFQNADGSLTAREIERVRAGQDDDNENGNGNTNTNGNDNANDNGNANDDDSNTNDDNQNRNQNQNHNGDDDDNANQNLNQNQNQNQNGDDDGGNQNQDQNQNQNGDDDGGNQNQNQNQNQNGDDSSGNQNLNQNQNQNQNGDESGGTQNQNQNGDDSSGSHNRNSNDNDDDDD